MGNVNDDIETEAGAPASGQRARLSTVSGARELLLVALAVCSVEGWGVSWCGPGMEQEICGFDRSGTGAPGVRGHLGRKEGGARGATATWGRVPMRGTEADGVVGAPG